MRTRATWASVMGALLLAACGAHTPLGAGRSDGGLDAGPDGPRDGSLDGPRDARRDAPDPTCCSSLEELNVGQSPASCAQAASHLAFAFDAPCDMRLERVEVPVRTPDVALLADTEGAGPGAVLVGPVGTTTTASGWRAAAIPPMALQGGKRYWVALARGTSCPYASAGTPTEYWGSFSGLQGTWEGPFFQPYVARLVGSACR